MNALIGSGFFARRTDFFEKLNFADHWLHCLNNRDIVVVNNSEDASYVFTHNANVREIIVRHNLGHIAHWLGKPHPRLLGWSMSWIIPAMIAYSERRDFIYVEQDCLVFGDWEQSILNEAKQKNLRAAFGVCPSHIAHCEQSLFWIECDFIPVFVAQYMSLAQGDADLLPEAKFMNMAGSSPEIGQFSLLYGRIRPIDTDNPTFYAQKLTLEEITALCKKGRL